jgi:replicative DNA helicase
MNQWDDKLMVLQDPETAYYEDLESWLRSVGKTDKVLDAIVIDTIQSMFMKKSAGGARWNQFEEMMVRMEKLAKDLGPAIVLTAQENTNRMKEGRDTVKQSDTGGSIAIVQKCSVTMHVVPKTMADTVDIEDLVEIQIPKNRITGTSFSHNPPTLKYNDDTKSFENYDLMSDDAYDESEYLDMPGGFSSL